VTITCKSINTCILTYLLTYLHDPIIMEVLSEFVNKNSSVQSACDKVFISATR